MLCEHKQNVPKLPFNVDLTFIFSSHHFLIPDSWEQIFGIKSNSALSSTLFADFKNQMKVFLCKFGMAWVTFHTDILQ